MENPQGPRLDLPPTCVELVTALSRLIDAGVTQIAGIDLDVIRRTANWRAREYEFEARAACGLIVLRAELLPR